MTVSSLLLEIDVVDVQHITDHLGSARCHRCATIADNLETEFLKALEADERMRREFILDQKAD